MVILYLDSKSSKHFSEIYCQGYSSAFFDQTWEKNARKNKKLSIKIIRNFSIKIILC